MLHSMKLQRIGHDLVTEQQNLLKLKLQYYGHLMQRVNSLEKTLMLGKTEGKSREGGRG